MANKSASIMLTDPKIILSTRAKAMIGQRHNLKVVVVGWRCIGALVAKGAIVKLGDVYYTASETGYIRNIARAATTVRP